MTAEEIRKRFLTFFENRDHAIIPSASLVPENDPSVLFTTAGMQPLVPFLLGEKHPRGTRLVNVQKCVRTQDIEEVGDNTHDTFFEMLGNWSLGDYFKEDTIAWSYEFLTSKKEGLGLDPNRLYVTCFEGDGNAPRDDESARIWKSLGIPEHRIYFLGAKSNWWSPGDNGPCGPDTEMFYDVTGGLNLKSKEEFLKADERQEVVEIWNDVFMEYEKKDGKVVGKLKQHNVDTGAGLERIAMVMQGNNNIFETDLFAPIMGKIDEFTTVEDTRARRILADHIRTSVFMIADGVVPSNTDRGYILRRLLRRAVRYADVLSMKHGALEHIANAVIEKYGKVYIEVKKEEKKIKQEILKEESKFRTTLEKGMNALEKAVPAIRNIGLHEFDEEVDNRIVKKGDPTGQDLFELFTTYGLPPELAVEEFKIRENDLVKAGYLFQVHPEVFWFRLMEDFRIKLEKHQELSRKGAEGKFKGGLADHSPKSVQYHTATHLLHQALRTVLGSHVFQKGSNITPERLRFDFSFERKMTDEEKKKVEDLVNEQIKRSLPVSYEDIPIEEAEKKGAIGLFEEKYGDKVRVYKIGDFSLEYCGGPHVENTSEIGKFKIVKEEAVATGVRRIKAIAE